MWSCGGCLDEDFLQCPAPSRTWPPYKAWLSQALRRVVLELMGTAMSNMSKVNSGVPALGCSYDGGKNNSLLNRTLQAAGTRHGERAQGLPLLAACAHQTIESRADVPLRHADVQAEGRCCMAGVGLQRCEARFEAVHLPPLWWPAVYSAWLCGQ